MSNTCLCVISDRTSQVLMHWHSLARASNFPLESMPPRLHGWRLYARAVMMLQKILPHKALITSLTPETKIIGMKSLMFAQMWPTSKGASTCLASVRLCTRVCNYMSFQLISPVELFCTACNHQCTRYIINKKQISNWCSRNEYNGLTLKSEVFMLHIQILLQQYDFSTFTPLVSYRKLRNSQLLVTGLSNCLSGTPCQNIWQILSHCRSSAYTDLALAVCVPLSHKGLWSHPTYWRYIN